MKKIIVALVAIVIGVAAHAAAIQWTASAIALPEGGSATSITAYLISTDTLAYDQAAATFAGGDFSALSGAIMSTSGIAVGTTAARIGKTAGNYNAGDVVSAYTVFVNSDQTAFIVSSKVITATAATLGNMNFGFGTQAGNAWQSAGTGTPEPTSGLLLLLGGAMLALRRKQKK